MCLDCIYDDSLRDQLSAHLTEPECSFCGRTSEEGSEPVAADFELLMEAVVETIRFLYERAIDVLFVADDVTPRLPLKTWHMTSARVLSPTTFLEAIQETVDHGDGSGWVEDPGVLPPDEALRRA